MASKRMTDEERYGKVGAEIRRLDPEAYKNRPKTMEGNLKLLKQLRGRSAETPARQLTPDEFMSPTSRRVMSDTSMPSSRGPSTRGGRRASAEETEASNRRIGEQVTAKRASAAISRASRSGELPSDRASGYRSQAEQTGMSAEERAGKARGYADNIVMASGAGKLGSAAGSAYRRTAGQFRTAADKASESAGRSAAQKGIPSFSERYRAREAAAAAREKSPKRMREKVEKMLDDKLAADMAGGYKKGGSVRSSASRRADGIALRGKTRGKYV
jgi:hypothetical protein